MSKLNKVLRPRDCSESWRLFTQPTGGVPEFGDFELFVNDDSEAITIAWNQDITSLEETLFAMYGIQFNLTGGPLHQRSINFPAKPTKNLTLGRNSLISARPYIWDSKNE